MYSSELSKNNHSNIVFMLEPSLLIGMGINDEMFLGGSLNITLVSFTGNANCLYRGYNLNYDYKIKKSPIVFLTFRFLI